MIFVRALGAGALILLAAFACNSCLGEDPAPIVTNDDAGGQGSNDAASPTPQEVCIRALPQSRACYTGPAGTRGKGICKDGELTCLPSGETSCVGQVQPAEEICNALDDDCNGTADDGIDTTLSPLHCGGCNQPCAADEACSGGGCQKRTETSCSDGVDNDSDQATDCADSECEQQACGGGCACSGLARHETNCNDGADNDGDTMSDCADSDCTTCGVDCTCAAGQKIEANCKDGVDNDNENGTDCEDPDCSGQACAAGCICTNGKKVETSCKDGVDNDSDGKKDCADSDCANKACTKSDGSAGTCKSNLCQ